MVGNEKGIERLIVGGYPHKDIYPIKKKPPFFSTAKNKKNMSSPTTFSKIENMRVGWC